MSALPVTSLGATLRLAGEKVRDKSYRRCPVGHEFARYLRACRWAGLTENTLLAYEQVGAWFAIDHDDIPDMTYFCSPIGVELIEDFLVRHWGTSAKATKQQRQKILRGFFAWLAENHRIPYDPTAALKKQRSGGQKARHPYPRSVLHRLLSSQQSLRDEVCLELIVRLGLRRNDIRMLQVRDVDLNRGVVLLLHGKGGEEAVLPIEYQQLRDRLEQHIQWENRQPAEYLLYGRERRLQPLSPAGVHDWFKRCVKRAELPSTLILHELRHTAADEMHRATGDIVKAQKLMRHKSPGTTAAYLHPLEEDLRAGMRAVEATWEEDA